MPRNSSSSTGGSHRESNQQVQQNPAALLKALLQAAQANDSDTPTSISHQNHQNSGGSTMRRKIWVRRPGASPTLITVGENDLVDDVRDLILRKYHNSLGRHFDSPDISIRILPREMKAERVLGPEEHIGRALDAYYPGGQAVDEALVIDTPSRKTPRHSPRIAAPHQNTYYAEEERPSEAGEGYFPPVGSIPSPHGPALGTGNGPTHAISILTTGQPPPIGSPGGTRSRAYRERAERPRLGRTHTSSPTILGTGKPASLITTTAADKEPTAVTAAAPPVAITPTTEATQTTQVPTPPAARGVSPRPSAVRQKKSKKNPDRQKPPVPPINVLIVEDNPINLKLLEAFAKGLKVRWQSAMNGRDAVAKWRKGGFHLVLMDIQLPVMNGLDATREIRRLERVNSIGVFTTSRGKTTEEVEDELSEEDRLSNRSLFKSPVIIVALTASSLQSDRHEALAAGCNDFITKPVSFPWLEMKVREWGCMQALIDFDGWRTWKDFSQEAEKKFEAEKKAASAKAAEKKAAKFKKSRLS